jgi:hypothetical protein
MTNSTRKVYRPADLPIGTRIEFCGAHSPETATVTGLGDVLWPDTEHASQTVYAFGGRFNELLTLHFPVRSRIRVVEFA